MFVVPAHNFPLTYTSNMDRQEIERQREKERWGEKKRVGKSGREIVDCSIESESRREDRKEGEGLG